MVKSNISIIINVAFCEFCYLVDFQYFIKYENLLKNGFFDRFFLSGCKGTIFNGKNKEVVEVFCKNKEMLKHKKTE
jgi:hypothetical protein